MKIEWILNVARVEWVELRRADDDWKHTNETGQLNISHFSALRDHDLRHSISLAARQVYAHTTTYISNEINNNFFFSLSPRRLTRVRVRAKFFFSFLNQNWLISINSNNIIHFSPFFLFLLSLSCVIELTKEISSKLFRFINKRTISNNDEL